MRVSCGCAKDTATRTLVGWIQQVGLEPIITSTTIRCVYEGTNEALGNAIVDMFSHEANHDITVQYTKEEQAKSARRAERKAARAIMNTKLHGH